MDKTIQTRLDENLVLNRDDSISKHVQNKEEIINSILNQISQKVYSDLIKRKRKKPDHRISMVAEFYPYTNIKLTVRKRKDKLYIRISDILIGAPQDVLESAMSIILGQYLNLKVPDEQRKMYKDYIYNPEIRIKKRTVRQSRARKQTTGPIGKYFDLAEVFDSINRKYFHGNIAKPELTWSARRSVRRLGHFDSDLNTLVVSQKLDNKNTPEYIIDYIVYHELLHDKYPGRYLGGRWVVHTREFKQAEKKFNQYDEAINWIKKMK
jgi:predicted metal-dependent hydrolase